VDGVTFIGGTGSYIIIWTTKYYYNDKSFSRFRIGWFEIPVTIIGRFCTGEVFALMKGIDQQKHSLFLNDKE